MEDVELNKNKKVKPLLLIFTIILGLGITLGAIYFMYYRKDSRKNELSSGLVSIQFTEGSGVINLQNEVPVIDDVGLEKTPYTFTVKNTSSIPIDVKIKLDINNLTTSIDKSAVRYGLYIDDELIKKDNIDPNNLILYTYENMPVNTTINCKLVLWIDYYYETPNKTFNAKIVVEGVNKDVIISGKSSSKIINELKTNKLTENNSITETNNEGTENEETITYISGCSKYYLDQGAEGCTQDNTIDFNYVWYSGRMWRITSFNETTNTIKLITQEPQTAIAWHDSSTAFVDSYVKQFLNDEFYDTLYQPTNFIDTSIKWDVTETTDNSTKLSNPTVTSNVGLLNSYEIYQSYQKVGSSKKYYFGYLNIGQYWLLLNPYSASDVWYVNYNGNPGHISPTITAAARPSINLKSDVNYTGSGTESDPYRLVGDMTTGEENDNLNTRQVGEYVKLKNGANEQVFRIVSFENNTTKLIALDYADNGNTKKFATANSSGNGTIFGEENTVDDTNNTTWYSYLKNVYISDLKTKYDTNPSNSMFTFGNYYLGINADNASDTTVYNNYRTSICASTSDLSKNCPKSRSKSLEAGLLRYGEMFASQHGIGYNTKTSTYNTKTMWLMTRRTASNVWFVNYIGAPGYYSPPNTLVGRPSINLASGVKIVACDTELCDGTPNHPYVVGL